MAARSYTTIKYDDDNYGDRGGGGGDGARHQDCWESGGSVNGRFIGGHGAGGGEVVVNDRVNGAVCCFGAIDMTTTAMRILGLGASRMERRIHGGGSGNNY